MADIFDGQCRVLNKSKAEQLKLPGKNDNYFKWKIELKYTVFIY